MKNSVVGLVNKVDWQDVAGQMHGRGYAAVPGFLSEAECQSLTELYDKPVAYRKTVVMERHRYGMGEYKYFDYPLPRLVQGLREAIYPQLVPIANTWMEQLKLETSFPGKFSELQAQCHAQGQLKPTPLLLKYGPGGFNALHQDLYGEVFFPLQIAVILNKTGVDYTGGEFVLMQQAPRAQGRAMVLNPDRGEMIIFTTNNRPVKGARGFHRVNVKHGVSEIHSGIRHTLGIIFHDAES
jgi:hypothetical protein